MCDHMSWGGGPCMWPATEHVLLCPPWAQGWGGTLPGLIHTATGRCVCCIQLGRLLFFISFPVRLTYSLSLCLNLSLILLLSLNHPRLVFLSASHSRTLHQAFPLPPSPTLPLLLSLHLPSMQLSSLLSHLPCCCGSPWAWSGQEVWGHCGFFPGAGGCSVTSPPNSPALSPSLPRLPGTGDFPSCQEQPGDAECLRSLHWCGCC